MFSFAQESTRYCNYSKDKFGKECTFIIPSWLSDSITREGHNAWHCCCGLDTYGPGKDCFASEEEYENRKGTDFDDNNPEGSFIAELQNAEFTYFKLLEQGWIAQQARAVLPNSLKTELVMTGFINDWWGEYLVFDKETGELIQRIHGSLYESLSNIDRDKYRIVESGFFPLRCSKGAHPQAYELAYPLREEFIKRGWTRAF